MKTANIITLIRIAMIPFFIAAWYFLPWYVEFTIFVLACASDKLDGYIARRYNQVTTFGKFIDPLADKLLICSALMLLVSDGLVSAIAAIIIIAREFIVTSLRVVAMSEGRVLAASISGKIKMVVQCVGIGALLTPLFYVGGPLTDAMLVSIPISDIIVWVVAAVTLWSGAEYCIKNRDVISSF